MYSNQKQTRQTNSISNLINKNLALPIIKLFLFITLSLSLSLSSNSLQANTYLLYKDNQDSKFYYDLKGNQFYNTGEGFYKHTAYSNSGYIYTLDYEAYQKIPSFPTAPTPRPTRLIKINVIADTAYLDWISGYNTNYYNLYKGEQPFDPDKTIQEQNYTQVNNAGIGGTRGKDGLYHLSTKVSNLDSKTPTYFLLEAILTTQYPSTYIALDPISGWVKAEQGEKGEKGERGLQGIQGEKGLQGIQGIQGLKGDQGIQGLKGDQGIQGLKGDQGIQGLKGDQGIQGLKGDKGDKGDTGGQGIQGEKGNSAYQVWLNQGNQGTITNYLASLKGERGEQGITGKDGNDGKNGEKGLSAYQVYKTISGNENKSLEEYLASLKGNTGEKGKDGINGKNGIDGADGKDGINGIDGDSAYEVWKKQTNKPNASFDEYLVAIKGEKGKDGIDGKDGINGINGTNGIDGDSAFEVWKKQTNQPNASFNEYLLAIKGEKGKDGIDGKDGINGINGTNGIDGDSAYEVWKKQTNKPNATFNEYLLAIKGDKGEKGDSHWQLTNDILYYSDKFSIHNNGDIAIGYDNFLSPSAKLDLYTDSDNPAIKVLTESNKTYHEFLQFYDKGGKVFEISDGNYLNTQGGARLTGYRKDGYPGLYLLAKNIIANNQGANTQEGTMDFRTYSYTDNTFQTLSTPHPDHLAFRFATNNAQGNATLATITSGGNFGIGTTNPTAKLEVNGDILISKEQNVEHGHATFLAEVFNDLHGAPHFTGYRSRGTRANPQAVKAGDHLAVFHGKGRSKTGGYIWSGGMIVHAEEDAGDTQGKAFLSFITNNGIGTGEKMRITGDGNVGIGTTNPTAKLHVEGSLYYSGSSKRYKQNINDLEVDFNQIYNLRAVSFDYKDEFKDYGKTLSKGKQIGLIAEEVSQVIPELAIMKDGEVSNVDYEKLSVLLLKAVQEMKKKMEQQEQTIKQQSEQNNLLKVRLEILESKLK